MLSDESFAAGVTILESRFGSVVKQELGQASDMVKRFYRQVLDRCLDDESFLAGIEGVIASCKFFPTPQQIIDAGIGTPREIALKEWNELVQYRAKPNQPLSFPISQAGEYAARSVGGIRYVCDAMSQGSRSSVRRDFIESYELALKLGRSPKANPVKVLTEAGRTVETSAVDSEGIAKISEMIAEAQQRLSMTKEKK